MLTTCSNYFTGLADQVQNYVAPAVNGIMDQWTTLDFSSPEAIQRLMTDKKRNAVISTLHTTGYLNDDQLEKIQETIRLYDLSMNHFACFKSEVCDLTTTSKAAIFWEGRAMLSERGESVNRDLLLGSLSTIAGIAVIGFSLFTSYDPYFLVGTMGAAASLGALAGSAVVVKKCLQEGYYGRVNGIAQKHFKKLIGEEKTQQIIDGLKATLGDDNITALEGRVNQEFHNYINQLVQDKLMKGARSALGITS